MYSTLHLNIPEYGKTHWFQLAKRKAGWLCVGLFAPEIVRLPLRFRVHQTDPLEIGFIAFQHWLFLKKFAQEMKSHLPTEGKTQGDDAIATDHTILRRFPRTQVHSHYALMGGFVFDTSGASARFFLDGRTRLILTPNALLKIAELQPDLIPDLSKGQIQDKSKADGFTKIVVCVQALWYVIPSPKSLQP